jgi:beta-1,4-mannosyltransferase
MPSFAVVVVGDIGRSPRMQYHADSLSLLGPTTVVGLGGSSLPAGVRWKALFLPDWGVYLPSRSLPFAILRAVGTALSLFFALLFLVRFDKVVVQNPPGVPALVIVRLVSWLKGKEMVVDWHNFGFSIMAHGREPGALARLGARVYASLGGQIGGAGVLPVGVVDCHPVLAAARWIEKTFGGLADGHLCVTGAMKVWLRTHWGITATVLHDRAPKKFRRSTELEAASLFSRLARGSPPMMALTGPDRGGGGAILVVSSTSWTKDEDFGLLLGAAVIVDRELARNRAMPRVVYAITGKGPEKERYLALIAELQLQRSAFTTLWLEPSDYPLLLGAADIGVCLHVSSSGLDLPMKVVDMFGCELPVCAVAYPTLAELVVDGVNGRTFRTKEELAERLLELMASKRERSRLRANIAHEQKSNRWAESWKANAQPLFL